MKKEEVRFKNYTFRDSLSSAFKGLLYAFKTEKNYKIYLGLLLFFLGVNIFIGVPLVLHALFFVPATGVFVAETLNTAIEHICNRITREYDSAIDIIKNIGSAAVLLWGFGFFIVEAIIIVVTLTGGSGVN